MNEFTPHPDFDLVLERTIPVSPEAVWAAWTEPELLMQWFTPAPWTMVSVDNDLRPGGRCDMVMASPEGIEVRNSGCYLTLEPSRLLVLTNLLLADFRPATPTHRPEEMLFTARVELEPAADGGTHYRAIAIHADRETAEKHEAMGFEEGWGPALDQLVKLQSTSMP